MPDNNCKEKYKIVLYIVTIYKDTAVYTHLTASGSKSLAGGRPLLLFLLSSSELRSTPLLQV